MKLREPGDLAVDIAAGRLRGATGRYVKTLRELSGLYADSAAFAALCAQDGERVVYEVTDYRPSDAAGDMILGVTCMQPGRVGDEFFLTRGHIHANPNRPEMYRGEAGHGVMLLESPDGEARTCAIGPGAICYVPPYWIHRSVNVGAEPLVMSFAYPADAGQDYAVIAATGGMRLRIVADTTGGWRAVPNAAWHPRPAAEAAAILARA